LRKHTKLEKSVQSEKEDPEEVEEKNTTAKTNVNSKIKNK